MELFDFHIHSIFSDGELIPAEIVRRCSVLGYHTIAISDHVDNSNIRFVLQNLVSACEELGRYSDIELIPGAEITHVPPGMMERLVKDARKLGAKVVIVHGESVAEPVIPGTNLKAAGIPGVDILAHPGLITVEEAGIAEENGVFLELTARNGHSLTNGHVARVAQETGARLLVNTDAHSPDDLITGEGALQVALGAGLGRDDLEKVLAVNPRDLIDRILE